MKRCAKKKNRESDMIIYSDFLTKIESCQMRLGDFLHFVIAHSYFIDVVEICMVLRTQVTGIHFILGCELCWLMIMLMCYMVSSSPSACNFPVLFRKQFRFCNFISFHTFPPPGWVGEMFSYGRRKTYTWDVMNMIS